jgi:uncharacterized protein YndB with AHSA1/START domain
VKPAIIVAEGDIRRSPEDVFDYCSDHRHEPEWNPMLKGAEKLTDGPIGVGTRYSLQFVKAPTMVMECTKYQPPTEWSLVGSSTSLTARGINRVSPAAEGAHLVMEMELEPHGVLKLVGPMLRRRMQTMFERDLENIKGRLERGIP